MLRVRLLVAFVLCCGLLLVAAAAAASDNSSSTNNTVVEATVRPRGHSKEGGGLMSMVKKFAPLLAVPVSLQALAVPFQLGAVYLMLFYSVLVGKLALTFMLADQFRRNAENAPLHEPLVHQHYGYGAGEEYGAWIT